MPVNREALGKKLGHLRQHLGLSIDELSRVTSIDEQRLYLIEAGELECSGDELLILADHYKVNFVSLLRKEIDLVDGMDAFYRSSGSGLSKDDRASIQEFLFLCENEKFLLEDIGRNNIVEFSPKIHGDMYKIHGVQIAQQLREVLGFKENQVPADIYYEFRRLGFHIFRRKLDDSNISGIFIKHVTAGKCILVNFYEDIYRQRFTVAHEVCHALIDNKYSYNISKDNDSKKSLIEIRANNFASEFLLPSALLKEFASSLAVGNDEQIIGIANRLQVNPISLAIALSEKCGISAELKEYIGSLKINRTVKNDPELSGAYSARYLSAKENVLQRGLSSFYVNLCIDAYEQGIISLNRLSYVLLCSRDELFEIAEMFGRNINVKL
ncbi:helix-turn-helix domain-containing protein [Desulfovibrio aminophilus]|uniref:helix-turn-helix domain-containing protein n=1 Tax=Desulfovibrio aminophilus TaxID=81425 RepID=UPI0009FBE40A|nr:XRE family transcriptional regulator [Desulfovibrio aminophilus]